MSFETTRVDLGTFFPIRSFYQTRSVSGRVGFSLGKRETRIAFRWGLALEGGVSTVELSMLPRAATSDAHPGTVSTWGLCADQFAERNCSLFLRDSRAAAAGPLPRSGAGELDLDACCASNRTFRSRTPRREFNLSAAAVRGQSCSSCWRRS